MKRRAFGKAAGKFGRAWARGLSLILLLGAALPNPYVLAEDRSPEGRARPSLAQLSLEDLMNIEVTSVSKKAEKLSEASAAVSVLTGEDIRRSGATSIAEALRLVPGLHVASINASKWVVSSRGFSDQFANKLLVLIDGRSVYTTLFSGVNWDVQGVFLEDIDRIEVIRGPGATLWGANAVNGVINVVTRKASETQGWLVPAAFGSSEKAKVAFRYGGRAGTNGSYRLFAEGFQHNAFRTLEDLDAQDSWRQMRGGFRIDQNPSPTATLTLQGDVYQGSENSVMVLPSLSPPYSTSFLDKPRVRGGNLLCRWNSRSSTGSTLQIQAYYDQTNRTDGQVGAERQDTWDFDLDNRLQIGSRHEVIGGVGYRLLHDRVSQAARNHFRDAAQTRSIGSAFLQDEIALTPRRLWATLGSKLEYNQDTHFEVQPSARLLWTPLRHTTFWGACSRAVRTPSRFERDTENLLLAAFPTQAGIPLAILLDGSTGFRSEEMLAYEFGLRVQPGMRLSLDLAAYKNTYDHFRSFESGLTALSAKPEPHLEMIQQIENLMNAQAYGLETSTTFRAQDHWKLTASYTRQIVQITPDKESQDHFMKGYERATPRDQVRLFSSLDLPRNLEADQLLWFVSRSFIHVEPLLDENIPAYVRLDLRLGWRPARWCEFSGTVQNLTDAHHREFARTLWDSSAEVPRSYALKMTVGG